MTSQWWLFLSSSSQNTSAHCRALHSTTKMSWSFASKTKTTIKKMRWFETQFSKSYQVNSQITSLSVVSTQIKQSTNSELAFKKALMVKFKPHQFSIRLTNTFTKIVMSSSTAVWIVMVWRMTKIKWTVTSKVTHAIRLKPLKSCSEEYWVRNKAKSSFRQKIKTRNERQIHTRYHLILAKSIHIAIKSDFKLTSQILQTKLF